VGVGKNGTQNSKITFCLPFVRISILTQDLLKFKIIRNIDTFYCTEAFLMKQNQYCYVLGGRTSSRKTKLKCFIFPKNPVI
jgi:hypothetical protein